MKSLIMDGVDVTKDLLVFARDLIQIKSYSGQEEQIARFIARKMGNLDFDEVQIDRFGNVLGRMGDGVKRLLFDSHMDTVEVTDEALWDVPPFSGEIVDGYLWGRGSADMKSSIAASIYAAAIAKSNGMLEGRTIYVSCTVDEEYCDGEALGLMLKELHVDPDYAVICEPSSNMIVLGHKGKAQVIIQTRGISAHGSAPENGVNAIYEMAEIIQRVERTNQELMRRGGSTGTLVMSQISSTSVSLNAVPSACQAYLDRRMGVGETEEMIREEMDHLVEGKNASWEIGTLYRRTWRDEPLVYRPFHPAWKIDVGHPLTRMLSEAYSGCFGKPPESYEYWDFSTNAVALIRAGIPTIGFGPGEHKLAHMRNEKCAIDQIVDACEVYKRLISLL